VKVFLRLPTRRPGQFLWAVEAELVVVLIFGLRHSAFLIWQRRPDYGPVSAVTASLGQRLWEYLRVEIISEGPRSQGWGQTRLLPCVLIWE